MAVLSRRPLSFLGAAALAPRACQPRQGGRGSLWLVAGICFTMACAADNPPPPAAASAAAPGFVSTPAIYAAFTLNLTRFISWPEGTFPSKTAPFVIGTFPRDQINEALDEAAKGEMVEGHAIRTMRIQSLDDLAKCQVVFLSKNNATRPAVLARVAHKPILTVSDAEGFLELGGHVRFVAQPPHTKLRVSPENLKASGLESRSQLLRLAATP